jgi:hypothetical protein
MLALIPYKGALLKHKETIKIEKNTRVERSVKPAHVAWKGVFDHQVRDIPSHPLFLVPKSRKPGAGAYFERVFFRILERGEPLAPIATYA